MDTSFTSMAALRPRSDMPRLFVVMGVSGCGKSTIAAALAQELGAVYIDGDLLHPAGNIDKMSSGTPLTDDDRWPWLDHFATCIAATDGPVVGACSALRRIYREHITRQAGEPVLFVHLAGSRELIAERMAARAGHFMPPSLLDSQFAALEVPDSDEYFISIDISGDTGEIVQQICMHLGEQT